MYARIHEAPRTHEAPKQHLAKSRESSMDHQSLDEWSGDVIECYEGNILTKYELLRSPCPLLSDELVVALH